MLKLILIVKMTLDQLLKYLNTSHVKVNHLQSNYNELPLYDLNTSHVKVNL